MRVALDEVVYFDAITSHPTTGAATDADSTPTFEVFEEATDTDIGVGGNLTKRTSKTGNYRGSFTASAANGFEAGKWYSVIGSATVNSVAGKGRLMHFTIVPAESSAGVAKVDLSHISGSAVSTSTAQLGVNVVNFGGSAGTFASGRPEVNTSHIAGSAVSTSTAQIGVNVVNFGGSAGTFASGRPEVNTTHAAGTAWGSGAITSGAFAAGAITASAIAADAIGASELAADAVTEIQSGLATAASIAALNNLSSADVSAAVFNAATASYGTAGSYGEMIEAIAGYLDTEVAAIKAKTDQLTFSTANRVDAQVYGVEAGAITAGAIAADAIGASELAADAANEIADALIARNIEGGSSTGRTVGQALAFLRNKWAVSAGTLTVYAADDSTTSWTAAVTTTAGNPITTVDPS